MKIPEILKVMFLLLNLLCSAESKFSFIFTKLHEAATLPCNQTCSGSVTWAHKENVLAQCDQTSCHSTEGFQMFHDQYLKGNLSLTISEADFSKRMWYTCRCDGKEICDVSLRIQPFSLPVSVQAGQSLSLDLPVPDNVEVILNRTDDGSSNTFRLCRIEGHKAQCDSLYKQRVSVGSSLQLKEVKNQDGGVYILWDIKNDEVIGMYTVTVTEPSAGQDGSVATPVAVVLGVLLVFAVLVIAVLFVKYQQLRKCLRRQKKQAQINMRQLEEQREEQDSERQGETEDQPEVAVHTPVMETDDGQGLIEQIKQENDLENEENASREEIDPLLEVDSPVTPTSLTDEPPLSHPVPDSGSANTQNKVF
ncbi:hypothetical protein AMEX_G25125 [Astyanax mexicanus]|uniref:Uncharacterized protein n=1 Tax=Astyanax mexicanus TaxID=7994 RepID=A0A8T2KQE8_ASTMX|nr:hypothetical protein AMEX_G25125 [Astyanax mexicanus]